MKQILVAGATGKLGQLIVRLLKRDGYRVRALCRSKEKWDSLGLTADEVFPADIRDPAALLRCCDAVDAVISCAGASMDIKKISDRSSFNEIDFLGNKHLLNASKQSGVTKFIYVSVAGAEEMMETEYCRAHVQFEQELERSGMDHCIVKPTGFFYFLGEIAAMAKQGRGIVFGDGSSRSNPIHEEEVAEICVSALIGNEQKIEAGGPEVFTRKEIVEAAFSAAGKAPSIISIPPGLFKAVTFPMKFVNPRIHALLDFGVAVSIQDAIAKSCGKRILRDYFNTLQR